ncbi:hypothetical protein D9M71_389700 [compost metagenome]
MRAVDVMLLRMKGSGFGSPIWACSMTTVLAPSKCFSHSPVSARSAYSIVNSGCKLRKISRLALCLSRMTRLLYPLSFSWAIRFWPTRPAPPGRIIFSSGVDVLMKLGLPNAKDECFGKNNG